MYSVKGDCMRFLAELCSYSKRAARKIQGLKCGLNTSLLLFAVGSQVMPEMVSATGLEGVPFVRNGVAGFVISDFKFALGPDAKDAGTCPAGMTMSLQEIFASTPGGQQRKDESDENYGLRVKRGVTQISTSATGENLCTNPESGLPDPHYQVVQGVNYTVPGIDLDGVKSKNDFIGNNGEPSVDNQFYRAVGCNRSFQSSGQSNGFDVEMLSGSWGIVIKLEGVDDLRNDDKVAVTISANTDPIQLSPSRIPLAYATYISDNDKRFRATTTGRIENGILRTAPVDMRFYSVVNSMVLERPLRDARVQATISDDGKLMGFLAGYSPVEAMYDVNFGYRNGKTRHGDLAPLKLRSGSANGAAFVLGHTCNGVYYAMHQLADGHPNASGEFTSISTQYTFEAIPAFVLDDNGHASNQQRVTENDYAN